MSYVYRCKRCGITSERLYSRSLAAYTQITHRAAAHGGHRPDGETVTRVRTHPGDVPASWYALAAAAIAVVFLDDILRWL